MNKYELLKEELVKINIQRQSILMTRKILNRNMRKFDKRLVEINYEVLKLKDIQEECMTEKTKRIIEKNEKDLKAAQKLIKECDNTIKRVDKLLAEIRRERLQKEKKI